MSHSTKHRTPLCIYHDGKPAKWPKRLPRFCTQRCAAEWAAAMNESMEWQPVEGSGYNNTGYDWDER